MNGRKGSSRDMNKLSRSLRTVLSRNKEFNSSKPPAYRIIIQMKQGLSQASLRELQQAAAPETIRRVRHLPLIRAISAQAAESCLLRLCACDSVKRIYPDRLHRSSLYIAAPAIGSDTVRKKQGYTGKGIHIAVLDTGVYNHPDLTKPVNRIVGFKDFVNGRKLPYDDNGHGTHVAGDAAGNGWVSKGKYKGAAPEAGIVGVKVLDREGKGYDSTIIQGIQWCMANRNKLKLRVLNLSLGSPALGPWSEDPMCQAVEKAVQAGLVVTAAAGNSGPGRGSVESPGISPSVITVGAVDDRRTVTQADDVITVFSGRGPAKGGGVKPDLLAPGETIISLRSPGSLLDRELPYQRVGRSYFTLSGTSMASPLVAGAAALLLQKQPGLSPQQVKEKLKRHAYSLGLDANTGGSGEVNVRFLIPGARIRHRPRRTARHAHRS
ncbi:S8 family peptidase [Paenibacillus lemnae]|uniref:S8 family peptidase n=1 Tax=Paenibacillus lemnae TaxID=1330551 RepID=A0A848M272_PAELE|nr:S8 family peptidase [Paenibacillus lemnae]NMO94369.1 S8 family peptidase [Paenibacillus lemnae]